jgi:7-dehydrocholesterol reductase
METYRQMGYLALLFGCPPFIMLCASAYLADDIFSIPWFNSFQPTYQAAIAISGYFLFQSVLMHHIVGEEGVKTIQGFFSLDAYGRSTGRPGLKMNNGVLCTLITSGVFLVGGQIGWWSLTYFYDHLLEWVSTMNIMVLVGCLALYFKGHLCPDSGSHGTSGSILFDYYWGMELHPKILGIDVKILTNCRGGMTLWLLVVISCLFKHYETFNMLNNGITLASGLQLCYLAKFFIWEESYYQTIDMAVDRAGFYLCWGCLVWLPVCYPSASWYLATHKSWMDQSHPAWFILVYAYGVGQIFRTYRCDEQKAAFKKGGRHIFHVDFLSDDQGHALLTEGWWGRSRHPHYYFEWMGTLSWSFPALHALSGSFYVIFLFGLLWDRIKRTEKHCAEKYGDLWIKYKRKVPRLVIPL